MATTSDTVRDARMTVTLRLGRYLGCWQIVTPTLLACRAENVNLARDMAVAATASRASAMRAADGGGGG